MIRRFISFTWGNISFQKKMALMFTVFAMIPLLLLSALSMLITSRYAQNSLQNALDQTTQHVNSSLNLVFSEAITLFRFSKNYKVIYFLNSSNTKDRYTTAKELGNAFSDLRSLNRVDHSITDISIIGLDGHSYSEHNGSYTFKQDLLMQAKYKHILDKPNEIHVLSTPIVSEQSTHDLDSIALLTGIFKLGTNEFYGIMQVTIDKNYLFDIIKNSDLHAGSKIILIDENGQPVLPLGLGKSPQLSSAQYKQIIESEEKRGRFSDTIDGKEAFIVFNTLESINWKIISSTAYSIMMQPVYTIRLASIAGIFLSLALLILINIMVSRNIVKPINELSKLMSWAAEGNLNISTKKEGNNEIALLYNSFDQMILNIKELLAKIVREQMNVRELEIKVLQEQINPHFLYNSLDSVVWAAENGNNQQVVDLAISLSTFYKLVLSGGMDVVSLDLEVQLVKSFLQVMEMRYQDILEYEFNIEEATLKASSPKILLQPIVENSIYHGIKQKRMKDHEKGKVSITTSMLANGLLLIKVEDNGLGMDEEKLGKIRKKLQDDKISSGENYGLKNVNQRIRLFFGSEYSLQIESKWNRGTKVEIIVPYIEKGL